MIRNLKAFGLALVAVFAMGAMVTSAAQAQGAAVLTTEPTTVTLDGSQLEKGVFQREARKVGCTTFDIEAHETDFNGDSTITTTEPTFDECEETVLKKSATVIMNGCEFTFHLLHDATGSKFTATADLECPRGPAQLIVYNTSSHTVGNRLCEYTFDDQTGKTTITLTNTAAGTKVINHKGEEIATAKNFLLADIAVGGIVSTRTFGVPLTCGNVNNSTGTISATVDISGTNANKEVTGVTVSTP